jgi:hypothetical protein
MYEEEKKQAASGAFRQWLENKNKSDKSKSFKQTNLKQTTQSTNKSQKAFKVPIGPYTNAKGLREIQAKLNNLNSTEMEYYSDEPKDNEIREIDEGQIDEEELQEEEEMQNNISYIENMTGREEH